jgi:hypothetical protein
MDSILDFVRNKKIPIGHDVDFYFGWTNILVSKTF